MAISKEFLSKKSVALFIYCQFASLDLSLIFMLIFWYCLQVN